MGYKNPVWHNGMAPSINDDRLNDLCYTVERLDFADGRVVVGQKEGETLGQAATSEGVNTVASGSGSHAEGESTTANGNNSHSEGKTTIANGISSHAEGWGLSTLIKTITGPINKGETTYTVNAGEDSSFKIGAVYKAKLNGESGYTAAFAKVVSTTNTTITFSESLNPDDALTGSDTLNIYQIEGVAFGAYSHAEGVHTTSSGQTAHAEGGLTIASGTNSHAEGVSTVASNSSDHSEGNHTSASGGYSHAEGYYSEASGQASHAEGYQTSATEQAAHAEGLGTTASGLYSHSEGSATTATGDSAHSEGINTTACGNGSHAEGLNTVAAGNYQHVFGKYNISNTADVEIVGWGTSETQKNIRTLDNSGNMTIAGTLTQSSDAELKTVEGEIPDVSEVHAVRFRWNDVNGQHDDLEHVGYIAQDIEKVAPFMVKEDSNGYKALDYIAFLCAKMETLERRVKELEEKKG